MHNAPTKLSHEELILLLCVTLGSGINWPIMKAIIVEVSPLTFRAICLFLGGLGMLAIARLRFAHTHSRWRPKPNFMASAAQYDWLEIASFVLRVCASKTSTSRNHMASLQ